MTRALTLEDVYRIPFVSDVALAPDGSRVAFVVTTADQEADENRSTIWVVDAASGAVARPVTRGPSDGAPRWSPDGASLLFVGRRDGDARPQLYLLPMTGGEPRRVTNAPGGASSPAWSPDGTRIAFSSIVEPDDTGGPVVVSRLGYKADGAGLLRGVRAHLFVCAVDGDGDSVQLTSGDAAVGPASWSPDGESLAFAGNLDPDDDLEPVSQVYVVAAAGGGAPEQVTSGRPMAAAPMFTPDGSRLLFAGALQVGVGHTRLFTVTIADDRSPAPLTVGFDRNVMLGAPAYPGGVPAFTTDGTTALFCARDEGCTHLYAVPADGGASTKVVGCDDEVVSSLSVAARADRMAYVLADTDTCGEVWVAGTDGSDATRLTSLVGDALGDVALCRPEPRRFTAPDGTSVHGWLLRGGDGDDADGARAPLLLDIHGGPHNAWSPVFDGVHLYHQVLAARGWSILYLNPRGSDGYGEAFYTALLKEGWGEADVDDFLAPVDALVADGEADPARLVVTGYSYGGFMTNLLTTRTDRFAAAISGGCVSDLLSIAGTSDLGHLLATLEFTATPAGDLERLVALSPIAGVGNVRTPTLILHGGGDERCPVSQAEEWFTALRVGGVETELVVYPDQPHAFVFDGKPSFRVDYCRRVVDWAEAHT